MTAISEPKFVMVGQLAGVYGVKGWLKVKSFTQPIENIVSYRPWRLRTAHGLKEIEVDDFKLRPQGVIVHFSGLDDRDDAAQLGRAKIEVDVSQLSELDAGDFYWHQLIGLTVVTRWQSEGKPNPEDMLLGKVTDMIETGANDVLVVSGCEGSLDERERLVPYIPGRYTTSVDLDQGVIHVAWDPEF